jgi:hypothetical protein
MANGIYKGTLHMRYKGQAIVNTLWYRSVLEGTFASDLLIDGARALGRSIISEVWRTNWKPQVPADLYFDGVSVMGYNDMFEALYNNTIFVATTGADTQGDISSATGMLPLANCVNLAFSLKNRIITLPFFKPPSKGLVALSPVNEDYAGNDGTLNDTGTSVYNAIAESMAEALPWNYVDIDLPFTSWSPSVGLPGAFVPIRAKTWLFDTPQILGGITYAKHIEVTDVDTCTARKLLGYRRSRRIEA